LYSPDPLYAGRIRAAQLAGITRLTPLAMIASCLNAAILLITLRNVGAVRSPTLAWAAALFGLAFYYSRGWLRRRRRAPDRAASPRALKRAILHAVLFGVMWGIVPVITFPGAPEAIQLLIATLTAGMMCAGAFVLGTVPLAGCAYVTVILAGSAYALLADGASAIHFGLLALLFVYAVVVKVNVSWNGLLFVEHFLAEARLQSEISARERAQAEVAHAQRMTALGELAGGVAHDFNNILQGIAGSAVLMARHAEDAGKIGQLSSGILERTERGGAITRRLLGFARRDTLCAEPVAAIDLLTGAAELARDALDASIEVRVRVEPGLPYLFADKTQLEIVLINLATNARDAMPKGGILIFSAERKTVTPDLPHPQLPNGNYIAISGTDTGCGMDEATRLRASEPFFTTKPRGQGTGLGLPMAKGFAEQSGGAFAITSTPGAGTTVTLWLPEARTPPQARFACAARKPPPRQRHVLVVDDDRQVRETMVLTLADAGFVISGAEDAPRALAHIDGGARIDALVTDLLMPGIDGLQLIQAARLRKPGLTAILLTGHMGDIAARGASQHGNDDYIVLQKPVRPDYLALQLAAALEDLDV
jgi:signal transduction histidine kinase/CheY-like chemotaxis protein